MQEVVLALLAKEPSHGYELRAPLRDALGHGRRGYERRADLRHARPLEKAGLVTCEREPGLPERPERKVNSLTLAGQQGVADWLTSVTWPGPASAEFISSWSPRPGDGLPADHHHRRAAPRNCCG